MNSPSSNTQTVILLCARLGQRPGADALPLKPREYIRLQAWLHERNLPPTTLCQTELSTLEPPVAAERLLTLLARQTELTTTLARWAELRIWAVSQFDAVYPDRLRTLKNAAPPLLCGAGDPTFLNHPHSALAIVGSRHADQTALVVARELGTACAEQGIRVVSGSARGVDSEAMSASIVAGGTVIGVLADSLAAAATSRRYRDALQSGRLTLVSPYDPHSAFSVGAAMGRNKYIYALADAGIVVSTAIGSGGTWAGAVEAMKSGRRVWAWLGDGALEGNRRLVEEGALPFADERMRDLEQCLHSNYPSG